MQTQSNPFSQFELNTYFYITLNPIDHLNPDSYFPKLKKTIRTKSRLAFVIAFPVLPNYPSDYFMLIQFADNNSVHLISSSDSNALAFHFELLKNIEIKHATEFENCPTFHLPVFNRNI